MHLGEGEWLYEPVENWAKLPPGWRFKEIGAVGTDRTRQRLRLQPRPAPDDRLRPGRQLPPRPGAKASSRARTACTWAPDDTVWLTDDADHTVRQCTLDGKILLTLGIPGRPAPIHERRAVPSLHPHGALAGRATSTWPTATATRAVHKFAPAGRHLMSWGGPGSDPGEFNIVHNITCDADGWVYVADRENHRIQVFDGNGRYETQWNNLHRPCGLYMPPGAARTASWANWARCMSGQPRRPQSRPAHLDPRPHRQARRPCRRAACRARARRVHRPARHRGRQPGRHLRRRGVLDPIAAALAGAARCPTTCARSTNSAGSPLADQPA